MNNTEYYITRNQELYDKCLKTAMASSSYDVETIANELYEDHQSVEHIVGHYLYWYGDDALKIWKNNILSRNAETDIDIAVTQILEKLLIGEEVV